MNSVSRQTMAKDLAEEAKKRIVILVICVIGLSYVMSLTSSSVWVNLPAAAALIIALRYFSLDIDMRRKTAAYDNKPPSANALLKKKPFQGKKVIQKSDWRIKVDSPVVEDAIDHFTRHIVSEWVTDLWYSRLTPDKEGPEELVCTINDVLAEISDRARNINLIDLLTRDLVNIFCNHLDSFRLSLAKIEKQQSEPITIENRDKALRHILASENKLHPALFSAKAEHKVLQHVMDGLISVAFKPEDLQCCFFHYVVRELLACVVIRPVLNLVNPRFINEKIESVFISRMKTDKGSTSSQDDASQAKAGPSNVSADHFSRVFDPSVTGVELVQLKNTPSRNKPGADGTNGTSLSKDPLLSMDACTSRSWNSVTDELPNGDDLNLLRHRSGGEWGAALDKLSHRKAQALAPEHFDNVWTKGKNYRKKDGDSHLIIEQVPQHASVRSSVLTGHLDSTPKPPTKDVIAKNILPQVNTHALDSSGTSPIHSSQQVISDIQEEDDDQRLMPLVESDSESTSYTSDDDEGTDAVTGLGSPGTRVWDARSKKKSASRIHHPLEPIEGNSALKTSKGQPRYQRLYNNQTGRRRTRPSSKAGQWQEVERTSFLSGDGQDILRTPKGYGNDESSSDDTDDEILGRANSGTLASSSYSMSVSVHHSSVNSPQNSMVLDSFLKLRCEVLGANIVKSDSKMFAVYSISVTDANSNSWSVKRRFRHFEELHRRLKYFPEYNLQLPPKRFLSTGLDVPIIQERSRLLDIYLKRVMHLPRISGSIEVWDFLSVDSQTYYFSNSFSIVETLPVNLEDKAPEKIKKVSGFASPTMKPLSSKKEVVSPNIKDTALRIKENPKVDGLRVNAKANSIGENDITQDTDNTPLDASSDPTLPTEWIPPNLSAPLLDLVDVIFQLQDGGWIRRKAFWVAKQVLQLGMSDAFDDWLLGKIQLLRRGSVVASGIKKLEQILWPDGIFITKHPKRRRPPPEPENSSKSPKSPTAEISSPKLTDEQQQEAAEQRAKFVYEIMIDKAPATIVSLVGHREYEQSAKDLYFFLQSSVCLKLLAFELLELLLVSAFPELEETFKLLHEEKHKFGEFIPN